MDRGRGGCNAMEGCALSSWGVEIHMRRGLPQLLPGSSTAGTAHAGSLAWLRSISEKIGPWSSVLMQCTPHRAAIWAQEGEGREIGARSARMRTITRRHFRCSPASRGRAWTSRPCCAGSRQGDEVMAHCPPGPGSGTGVLEPPLLSWLLKAFKRIDSAPPPSTEWDQSGAQARRGKRLREWRA